MKKIIYLLSILAALMMISCSKNPANGSLDGQWQLMEISSKADPSDSTYSHKVSKKEELTYWRFQLDLLMIHTRNSALTELSPDVAARFRHTNHQLDITTTYIHFRECDSLLTDPATQVLEPVGISGNAESFQVKRLDSKEMVLTNDKKKLVFRKF